MPADHFPEPTPRQQGYTFPAEWAPHRATWLSWIHKEASWPGKLESAYAPLCAMVKALALNEQVCINVAGEAMEIDARARLEAIGTHMAGVSFYHHPTNDAWCRDHGPAFVVNETLKGMSRKAVVNWGYNAWGGKYPPYDLDDQIPMRVATALSLPRYDPGIIMEGGSVEFNGAGTILTTEACLLNPNRNPHLTKEQIERYLLEYYGQEQVLWLGDGIVGDDTDGHIDDLTRFVDKSTVVTVVEQDRLDENYDLLQENLTRLKAMRLTSGERLEVIHLPMPRAVVYDDQRLPASYANYYIANGVVIVPVFSDRADDQACRILEDCYRGRQIIPINSRDLIWGLGSFHCLTQQEPA